MRGVTNDEKRRALFDYHRKNADILIMQETHGEFQKEKVWTNEWGGSAFFAHGTSASKGIAMFIAKQYSQNVSQVYKDNDGRTLIVDLVINELEITIAAIYAPNEDSPCLFFKIRHQLLKERHENKIIIGDFNLTLRC